MRVIAGQLRGRRLTVPASGAVRPTSDRVREAMFDMLFSLGDVEGLRVADLFAGSGALGIEALSRGATSVTFVDNDAGSLASVRRNLAAIGMGEAEASGVVSVVRSDAVSWSATTAARFDLVFCDPPYAFARWDALMPTLPGDLVVVESGTDVPVPPEWGIIRSRRYGGTLVTVARTTRAVEKGAS